jgi:hypothetical protein
MENSDMADMTDLREGRPRLENRVTLGNVITIVTLIVAGAAAWGTSQSDIRALAQRVDKGESRDDETARTLGEVRGSIIELRSDQRAIRNEVERQGRQLDRIEQLLRGTAGKNGTP